MYLLPVFGVDDRVLVLFHVVVLVHLERSDFGGGTQHFYDLNQLIDLGVTKERWVAVDHLDNHTAYRPNVDLRSVVGRSEYELGGSIAS